MRQFIRVSDFTRWFINYCDEPIPVHRLYDEFEACIWMPLEHLSNFLSPEAMENLAVRVPVFDEQGIEILIETELTFKIQ